MKKYDVIILGAGASGLMCASNLGKKKSVLVIDTNDKVARKLQISGGGKCNITNVFVDVDNFDGDTLLVKSVLKKFSKESLINFLERSRVPLEIRKGRYYFCQNSAEDIIELLKRSAKHSEILLNTQIIKVDKEKEDFCIQTSKGEFFAEKVVVATGGKSFANIGASEIGLEIAKNFGIEVQEFTPALVGLTVQKEQFWMKELSGLSCYVHIKVGEKLLKEEMLFTHKGISGPAVLSASLYWKKGLLSIDFLPNLADLEELKSSNKQLSTLLKLPKRLAKALLVAVELKDKVGKKLQGEDLIKLKNLQNYSFAPAGNFGFTKAEVSRGGVISEELLFDTLEAKKVKGLYFIGEVVDITGELGGYNFQWAFSSAYVCAKAIK
jgi:hypothetical protein